MRKSMFPMGYLFAAVIAVLSLTGCTKIQELAKGLNAGNSPEAGEDENEMESDAVKYGADTVYHNAFLDFSYAVPKGWWLYSIDADNFSADPEETADAASLDIGYGEDAGMDYRFIDLISFANLQFSTRDNHLGFDISAETLDGIGSMAEYMEYYESFMLEPDKNQYALLDSGQVNINGLPWERRIFEVISDGGNFCYLTFTRAAGNGYYLTIRVSYWPENKTAEEVILAALSKAMS